MTEPNVTQIPVPELSEQIGVGIQAVAVNAKALGMKWDLQLATVTSNVDTNVKVTFDGDSAAISAVSMVGGVSVGQRVYVLVIPPSGNYIIGSTRVGWIPWETTLTALTVGSGGTLATLYQQLDKTINFLFRFTFGTGSAVGTGPRFTLPVMPDPNASVQFTHIGYATLINAGTGHFLGAARLNSDTIVEVIVFGSSGTYVTAAGVTALAPFTWGTGDSIVVTGTYKAA